jgi:hypothetical protein
MFPLMRIEFSLIRIHKLILRAPVFLRDKVAMPQSTAPPRGLGLYEAGAVPGQLIRILSWPTPIKIFFNVRKMTRTKSQRASPAEGIRASAKTLKGNLIPFAQNQLHEVSKRSDVFLKDLLALFHARFFLVPLGTLPPEPLGLSSGILSWGNFPRSHRTSPHRNLQGSRQWPYCFGNFGRTVRAALAALSRGL